MSSVTVVSFSVAKFGTKMKRVSEKHNGKLSL